MTTSHHLTALPSSEKSWRRIFYDQLQSAVINDFILFEEYRKLHLDASDLPSGYSQDNFRTNLIRQLADIDLEQPPTQPVAGVKRKHA